MEGPWIIDPDVEAERIIEEERGRWVEASIQMERAQEAVEQCARERERIVLRLQNLGLGFRRIAQVLGVTHHQQIDQIARRAKRRQSGGQPSPAPHA